MDSTQSERKNEHNRPSPLLERVREQPCFVVDPTTEEEARQKAKLITEHRSEFPLKLRPAIEAALVEVGPENQPEIFLSEVYVAAKEFFLGRSIQNENENDREELELSEGCCEAVKKLFFGRFFIQNENEHEHDREENNLSEEWHGLDSDIDTEEEVELAIRFFPSLMTDCDIIGNIRFSCLVGPVTPILLLIRKVNTVSFLPLFLKLCWEFDQDPGMVNFLDLLFVPGFDTFAEMMGEEYAYYLFHYNTNAPFGCEAPTEDTDEESLSALMRLREMSDTPNYAAKRPSLKLLLSQAKRRKSDFMETRVRLLVDWYPSTLMEFVKFDPPCCKSCSRKVVPSIPLLCVFLEYYSLSKSECSVLQMFEIILELGMIHFPTELGFVFHQSW
eukprot:CAMPEP_0194422896 /NCGR_PEP_ID=MMETSP0176-20130528/22231_1 /TAXON_ID=216777 /ORGANISM="Proboscia alata, Strain PI-D3" /LENGTH=387 /DNA_ID=CAMNT_0039231907 /DNA_START=65 /DNA_END=1225 /DNA_ORIENTATION=-